MEEDYDREYSDAELQHGLEQLGVFNGPNGARWQVTLANKDHIDALGAPIDAGDEYFCCHLGVANNLRLSKESADRFLHVLFTSTPALERIGEEILESQKEEVKRWFKGARRSRSGA